LEDSKETYKQNIHPIDKKDDLKIIGRKSITAEME